MTEKTVNIRNNFARCPFNNSGYCRYEQRCRNYHSKDICRKKIGIECPKRHPKPCKRVENCKFFVQDICAYDHENPVENKNKDLEDKYTKKIICVSNQSTKEINDLQQKFEEQKREMETIKNEKLKILKKKRKLIT